MPPSTTAAHHAYTVLARLPLPLEQRAAVLADLYRATHQPPPPLSLLQRWLAADTLPDLPPAAHAALCAALCAPSLPATLAQALATLSGQTTTAAEVPEAPHPLGPDARFPPRIAALMGVESRPVSGTPRPLPGLPFSARVLHFRDALRLDSPPESAIIIGAGYVGAELALGWADTAGCEVTLLDRRPVLMPGFIPAHVAEVRRLLEAAGVQIRLGVTVTQVQDLVHHVIVQGEEQQRWTADRLVVAAGLSAVA